MFQHKKENLMMKKPLSILLALVLSLHLAVPALAAQAPEFSDVPTGHWAST